MSWNTDNAARHTDSFQMSAELANGVVVDASLPRVYSDTITFKFWASYDVGNDF